MHSLESDVKKAFTCDRCRRKCSTTGSLRTHKCNHTRSLESWGKVVKSIEAREGEWTPPL